MYFRCRMRFEFGLAVGRLSRVRRKFWTRPGPPCDFKPDRTQLGGWPPGHVCMYVECHLYIYPYRSWTHIEKCSPFKTSAGNVPFFSYTPLTVGSGRKRIPARPSGEPRPPLWGFEKRSRIESVERTNERLKHGAGRRCEADFLPSF